MDSTKFSVFKNKILNHESSGPLIIHKKKRIKRTSTKSYNSFILLYVGWKIEHMTLRSIVSFRSSVLKFKFWTLDLECYELYQGETSPHKVWFGDEPRKKLAGMWCPNRKGVHTWINITYKRDKSWGYTTIIEKELKRLIATT